MSCKRWIVSERRVGKGGVARHHIVTTGHSRSQNGVAELVIGPATSGRTSWLLAITKARENDQTHPPPRSGGGGPPEARLGERRVVEGA